MTSQSIDAHIQTSEQNWSFREIPVSIWLGAKEVLAWIAHGKKEPFVGNDDHNHRIVLDGFTGYRSEIERDTWVCDRRSSRIIGTWLTLGSYHHDLSEFNEDKEGYSQNEIDANRWPETQQALKIRYLLGLVSLWQKGTSRLPSAVPLGLYRGFSNEVEELQIFEILRSKLNINQDDFEKILAKAQRLADLETEFWQAHHYRKHDEAIIRYTKILVELGYSNEIAEIGAKRLVGSYQFHDAAEKILERNPNAFVLHKWAFAFISLVGYFNTVKTATRNVQYI